MFIAGLSPNKCARCLCDIVDGDLSIVLTFDDKKTEAPFCYECGIKEMAHSTGKPESEVEREWRDYFKMDELFKEPPNENVQT